MLIIAAGENRGLPSAPSAPPSVRVLQENNGKGIKTFLTISNSKSMPGPDLSKVQPAPKRRRQTLKDAARAKGQQQLKLSLNVQL